MPAKLIIKNADSPVPESGGKWRAGEIVAIVEANAPLGSGEVPEGGKFVHFTVTDKSVGEVSDKLDTYNRDIQMSVFQGPNPDGLRSIHVRNLNCNVSGTIGAWTTEITDQIIAEWNERYPTCGLITLGYPFPSTWDCRGTFTTGQAQEFNDVIIEKGKVIIDHRKVWYITPAGMTNIINAGGSQSGTAQQLNGILRDRRLD